MNLTTLDFSALVTNQVTAIQAAARQALDFGIGSILRSVVEANSGVMLWLQGLILQVLTMARAATSAGTDLDSFVADYGLARLGGVAATGQVTFSRFTTGQQAFIPLGSLIQTADGAAQFIITEDDLNSAWSAGQQGYVVPAGTASVSVPVECLTVGVTGNIALGTLTVNRQSIPYIDTVTNGAAYTNGLDAETDSALRMRFVAYIGSLARATPAAIGYAVLSVRAGLTYTLTENAAYDGSYQPGYFYVVVDDGTGYTDTPTLDAVFAAVEQYRALCISYGVFAPAVLTAAVQMSVAVLPGYDAATVKIAVHDALVTAIDTLTLGQSLYYTHLYSIAYAIPGVQNVTGVLLNAGTADLSANQKQVVKAATVIVS